MDEVELVGVGPDVVTAAVDGEHAAGVGRDARPAPVRRRHCRSTVRAIRPVSRITDADVVERRGISSVENLCE